MSDGQHGSIKETAVTRKYIDCREFPSKTNCTVGLSADTENELLDAAVQHAVSGHEHTDSPERARNSRRSFTTARPPSKDRTLRGAVTKDNAATRLSGKKPLLQIAAWSPFYLYPYPLRQRNPH
jgi:predicted small metal-binding protein